jgi:flagellar basal body rod protein FlgG
MGTWHRHCFRESVNLGIYNGVTAGRANERRLEAITANLANLDTPAYKRISSGTRAFQLPGGRPGDHEIVTHTQTDFTQGTLTPSSSSYHMALMGQGFFQVEGPHGELNTRNGLFHVDAEGNLQSEEGYPVAWEFKTGQIDPTGELVTVDGGGLMRQGNVEIGQVKIVDFDRPTKLESIGGGYFLANAASGETESDAVIHQNHLESSNVTSIDELVAMITIQRSFENAKNVMSLIDQSYGRLTQIR